MVGTTRSSGAGTTHDAEVRFGPGPQVLRAVRPQCGGTPIAQRDTSSTASKPMISAAA
jgi:hypothetical protein